MIYTIYIFFMPRPFVLLGNARFAHLGHSRARYFYRVLSLTHTQRPAQTCARLVKGGEANVINFNVCKSSFAVALPQHSGAAAALSLGNWSCRGEGGGRFRLQRARVRVSYLADSYYVLTL